jgi:hypothetical protein
LASVINGFDGLKFGEGITKDDVTITQEADGFVYIRINNTTDVVKFTQASTTSTLAIDYIYFADNSRIKYAIYLDISSHLL